MSSARVFGAFLLGIFFACFFAAVAAFIGTIFFLVFTGMQGGAPDPFTTTGTLQTYGLPNFVNIGTLIGGGLGLLIGLFVLTSIVRRAQRIDHLQKKGMHLTALVTNIRTYTERYSSGDSYNTRTVSDVTAEWIHPTTQQRYVFQQKTYGSPMVSRGGPVTVYVDHNNFNEYHMEL